VCPIKREVIKGHEQLMTLEVDSNLCFNPNLQQSIEVERYQRVGDCPFCQSSQIIESMNLGGLVYIDVCTGCLAVWQLIPKQVGTRLTGHRALPQDDHDSPSLCVCCWAKMVPDYEKWIFVCPNPTCHSSKRIPGLSKQQRERKKKYLDKRSEIFNKLMNDESLTPDEVEEYRKVRQDGEQFANKL